MMELENMAGGMDIFCTACRSGAPACFEDGRIHLYFDDPRGQPTDYALLHELIHKVGFSYRYLPRTYTRDQVEAMAHQVAGAEFGTSEGEISRAIRICSGF